MNGFKTEVIPLQNVVCSWPEQIIKGQKASHTHQRLVYSCMWFAEVWYCNIWTGFVCVWMSWLDPNLLWQDHDEKQLRLSNSLSTARTVMLEWNDAQIQQLFNESFLKRRLSVCPSDCCVKWTTHAFFWSSTAAIGHANIIRTNITIKMYIKCEINEHY